jgi:hypothetical protein
MGNKVGKLCGHTSSSMAYCEIPLKKGVDQRQHLQVMVPQAPYFAHILAHFLENQSRAHDVSNLPQKTCGGSSREALLATVDEDICANFRPCDVSEEIQFLKFGKARGFDGVPKECLRHLPRRSLVHLKHFIQSLTLPWSLPGTLEGRKNCNPNAIRQRPKFSPKCTSDQSLVHYGQNI